MVIRCKYGLEWTGVDDLPIDLLIRRPVQVVGASLVPGTADEIDAHAQAIALVIRHGGILIGHVIRGIRGIRIDGYFTRDASRVKPVHMVAVKGRAPLR